MIQINRKITSSLLWIFYILLVVNGDLTAQNKGATANNLFGRKYIPGETYRYKLTMEELHNGVWDHTNISVCELKVVKDSRGIPYDRVRWISRKTIDVKDTSDLGMRAGAVKPYLISLAPGGKIGLPEINIPEMTESIQDLNTFFVAVSPLIGTRSLARVNDSIVAKEPVKADFSNGSSILKGEDCIVIGVKITGIFNDKVLLQTSFLPSVHTRLGFLLPEMNKPVVADTINNFQMVIQTEKDKYLVQYGRELFYINSTIRRSDGKIISATMHNKLDLKMKINCDREYKNCQFEIPFSETRNLKLELL